MNPDLRLLFNQWAHRHGLLDPSGSSIVGHHTLTYPNDDGTEVLVFRPNLDTGPPRFTIDIVPPEPRDEALARYPHAVLDAGGNILSLHDPGGAPELVIAPSEGWSKDLRLDLPARDAPPDPEETEARVKIGLAVLIVLFVLLFAVRAARGAGPLRPPAVVSRPTLPEPFVRRLPLPDRPGCARLEPGAWRVVAGDRIRLLAPVGEIPAGVVVLVPGEGAYAAPGWDPPHLAKAQAATARLETLLRDAAATWIETVGPVRDGRVRVYRQVLVPVWGPGGILLDREAAEDVAERLRAEGWGVPQTVWSSLTSPSSESTSVPEPEIP